MALKLILFAALAVASDASSILREAKDNVKKQMTDQNARRTQDVDACGCTFPFKTETTADDGSITPFRYYGCMVTDTADYGWTVDTEPWCEYHYDTDADGANDVNGWGYCGAKGALEPEGDLDCVEGLDPDAKTSSEACFGCAELAALVGGEFTGACIDNYGDGFYCDTYWTLKDRLDRDIDAEPYYWMYCDAPTDEAPRAFTDDDMVAGYGCSVDGEPEFGPLPPADEEDHHDDHDGHDHDHDAHTCYSAPGEVIHEDCACDATCATCGYNAAPTDYRDCIACAEGLCLRARTAPRSRDGTGPWTRARSRGSTRGAATSTSCAPSALSPRGSTRARAAAASRPAATPSPRRRGRSAGAGLSP
mmetsp:Transcript_20704/g.68397  ORF Transcript_20704/g.68397 Transcript_20704/m.68397 type:complete len:363 (+) Transcript_20704:585-1673(+)